MRIFRSDVYTISSAFSAIGRGRSVQDSNFFSLCNEHLCSRLQQVVQLCSFLAAVLQVNLVSTLPDLLFRGNRLPCLPPDLFFHRGPLGFIVFGDC